MSSSSPAILPISTPQAAPPPPPLPATGALPISTPALRRFLSRLSDALRRSFANRRPWSELLDLSSFSRPESLADAYSRLRRNLPYFRTNYLALLLLALAASLLSHPFSLLALLLLLAAWSLLYLFRPADQPVSLLGRRFSDRETLAALLLLTLLVLFLTSVGSLLVSAFLVAASLICAHGSFRVPEDLFLDDQETSAPIAPASFMSFLGGAAPAVSVHV